MKKVLIINTLVSLLTFGNHYGYSQSVGVSATGAVPNASALLDVDATGMANPGGMLIPRVSLTGITDVATILSPANSLIVYNTNATMTNGNGVGFYYYNTTAVRWIFITSPTNGPGTNGQVLTSGGAGAGTTWTNPNAGTVTTFSSGALAPLFTTSVATAGTTPALSFTLSTPAAYTMLGNNSAIAAAPTFFTPTLASALFLNQGTTTTILHGNAAGNPSWTSIVNSDITNATIDLTTKVTGILPLANGGSSANLTAVNGGAVYSTGTALAITAAGSAGQVLKSNGAAAPTWQADNNSGGSVTTFSSGALAPLFTTSVANAGTTPALSFSLTNANALTVFGNTTNASAAPAYFAATAASGNILRESGSTIGFGTINLASAGAVGASILPIANGGTNSTVVPTAGAVAYGTGTTYSFTAVGSAGQVLTSNAGGTPTWSSASGWGITGNTGTTASAAAIGSTVNNNFIGTTDAKDFVLASNNLERMRLTSAGNIGVGTITPSSQIDVTKTAIGATPSDAYGMALINTTAAANNAQQYSPAIHWKGSGWNTGGASNAVEFRAFADAYQSAGTPYGALCFQSQINGGGYATMMRISNRPVSGVGVAIGDFQNPQAALEIRGTSSDTYLASYNAYHSFGESRLYLTTMGGTPTAPTASQANDNLGSIYFMGGFGGSVSGTVAASITSSTTATWSGSTRAGDLRFSTINTVAGGAAPERMRITGDGNVGIGTISPSGQLDVSSSFNTATGEIVIKPQDGTNEGGQISLNGAAANPYYIIDNYAGSLRFVRTFPGGASVMELKQNGNVGIGISPSYALDVSGQTRSSSGFWDFSDVRFKKNIQPITSALSNVLKVQGVTYLWKNEEFPEFKFGSTIQYGVIAQDLEKIFPELVNTDAKGDKAVEYSKLTPILVEAIKEQQKMIEEMKLEQQKEIVGLKEENRLMSAKIEALISAGQATKEAKKK